MKFVHILSSLFIAAGQPRGFLLCLTLSVNQCLPLIFSMFVTHVSNVCHHLEVFANQNISWITQKIQYFF